jgi:cytochrome b6-f complex iron-sulfur subunit
MSVPTEKPDPVKDYEAYKAWRAANKGKAATATEEKSASGDEAADQKAEAPAANAEAPKTDEKAEAPAAEGASSDPMPHPIEEYQAYKAWKARMKSGGKKKAAGDGDGDAKKPLAPHVAKFKKAPESRRNVLFSFGGFMWMLYTGFLGIFGAAMGRFFFPNVLYEPPTTFKIGRPSDFLPDSVDTRFKSSNQIWVVRDDLGVYVLKAVCTHLGCTPSWLQAEEKYKCPCHGSGFRMNGMNFEGPAPRPLERYKVALADDGQIVVDSSKVFLQPNEWTNAEAYIPA